ncbi:hypothetical protein N0V91_008353 [Didymella pomorum]|uniref:Uncharacterized protein n=1 Tax=Didymella pomorum TaxID=749634 RepID=A0A9W8Z938_9PLEO|nr:hypothetical protein N0V91_008353 [Didymella pomorum]
MSSLEVNHEQVRKSLPEEWQWDIQYLPSSASWICTPQEPDEATQFPLTIAGAPVVLPVEHHWPPVGGVNPPPDPRFSTPIDCRAQVSVDIIRDIFVTFEGSVGFYILINGLLQVIVPPEFDTTWASSHLPHKFGGLKVSYIESNIEPTMLPSKTATTKTKPSLTSQNTVGEGIFLNQMAAAVSHAVLYRVNPDFDPPSGFSGIALYAEGMRTDGTEGPGVVGFQSFVQRSGQVQNYNMEGSALDQRLKRGRVAFYGAFQVPHELRKEYTIV